MALTSFTLRKTTVGFGSSLRKTSSADNSLRADGVSTSGIQIVGENEFSATIIDDGKVRLSWILADSLVDAASILSGSAATEIVIVSSISGEPVTINDGLLVTRITDTTTVTFYDDTPLVQEGRWVYYTLFIKYSDGTDYWYEAGGTLYIQIPVAYNSTADMWQHTPEYYRSLDYTQAPLSKGLTPLYAFLDLIGDEVDRTKTLIDTIALSNDPEIAVTPALEQLAMETGLEISLTDLGATKARNLLSSVGYLRQRKGTISSIVSYISAMSGCVVEYEYKPAAAKPHIFHVYAQRQNFISDPNFTQATITTNTATVGAVKYTLQTTPTWGVYTYGNESSGTVVTPTITNTNNGLTIAVPNTATSNRTVLVYPRKTIPYVTTKTYGTSFDVTLSGGASFNLVHTASNATRLLWEAGVTGASAAPTPLYQDGAWITSPTFDSTTGTQRYVVQYPAQSGASYSVITSVPVIEFTLPPGESAFIGEWLWEMGTAGPYFYGGSREGGYIPISTGSLGQGTFDYYWGPAGADLDYSYYMLDHERVIKTVERVIANSVIPVPMLDSYTIDWNYYIGKP
jgi:hypothetical protein